MLEGIPYLTDPNFDIDNKIYTEKSITLRELAELAINTDVLVILDNKWVSWLKDLRFNYRDKRCYLPYYTYELTCIGCSKTSTDFNQLYTDEQGLSYIRHSYNYSELEVAPNTKLYTYSCDTGDYILYNITGFSKDIDFNLETLYQKYLVSCYTSTIVDPYDSGYHFITRQTKQLKNPEKSYRHKYSLPDYSYTNIPEQEYRDVRQYKYEEVVLLTGFTDSLSSYKLRRLDFESYLYCLLRQPKLPEQLQTLKSPEDYIKIGKSIKLIIKGYWLPNINISDTILNTKVRGKNTCR